MTPRRKSRLYLAILMLTGAGLIVTLVLYALSANIDLFYTPREILEGKGESRALPHIGQRLRIGGMVMPGSVKRDPHTLKVTFRIYDAVGSVPVSYDGILPDLFREGQGVVAQGVLAAGNRVEAREVLAKHDENYTPPEVTDAMKTNHKPTGQAMAGGAMPGQAYNPSPDPSQRKAQGEMRDPGIAQGIAQAMPSQGQP
ncbi:cytochrome c maturation protein CcmE [Enterobacteriales bacterium SAP-6]|uniref:Cytochrome c-type biogenesis protein CcmE n=1 Tax=Acerihabitans arboris TaxID=2691583 RepID=A0A845SPR4_9GAMM|nr:cytochrome c maturation protein CcmE [Acerihabitans arboris]NDL65342.1 cytochrome c maturation protein CcmE [Acerihabitans arboris]